MKILNTILTYGIQQYIKDNKSLPNGIFFPGIQDLFNVEKLSHKMYHFKQSKGERFHLK